MDKRKTLTLLAVIAITALIGGTIYAVYAASNGEYGNNGCTGWVNCPVKQNLLGAWGHGPEMRHLGGYGLVEVSEEYKEKAINIAKSDSDVQDLVKEGYNITGVRPIIATKVEADGTVVTKASNAIVMLQKDTAGCASVWVNLEEGKVTKIVILSMTVIEKS